MSTQYTAERYNAITRMINSGESLLYSCGMYDTPINMYNQWAAGLSVESIEDKGEKYEEALQREALTWASTEQTNNGRENNRAKVNETKGHLAGSGGIRGHSAGDIFPLIIVAVGSFKLGFSYHIIGNGFKIGDKSCISYGIAHHEALLMVMGAP